MEHLASPIIAGVRKERIPSAGVELDGPDRFGVVAQRLVRAGGEIEVMPQEASIVGACDEVVTSGDGGAGGMDIEAADPPGTGLEDPEEGLSDQVIGADAALVGDEEDGCGRMKVGGLGRATPLQTLTEGKLGQVLGECVDSYCS